jgi:hypothetical protein
MVFSGLDLGHPKDQIISHLTFHYKESILFIESPYGGVLA